MSNNQMINVPRDEVERLVKLLQYQSHPYPSPHAEFWQGQLNKPVPAVSVQRFWAHEAQNIRCVRETDYDTLELRLINAEGGLQWESERNALLLAELQAGESEPLTASVERVDALELLLEQVLTNANRGLPPELQRSIRKILPAQEAPASANEEEREPFEAWHRRRFATKHSNGQPTRDMHNGVHDQNYGPPAQQQMWEAWQARAALKSAVGDLHDL